jgi:hypothetical protein
MTRQIFRNNVDLDMVLPPFFECDGVTPLYLTVDGKSGSDPLPIAMSMALYPGQEAQKVVLNFSTEQMIDGTLQVLDAPNDNQLYWNVPDTKMLTLDPGIYGCDMVSPPAGAPRRGLGAFQIELQRGQTADPQSGP